MDPSEIWIKRDDRITAYEEEKMRAILRRSWAGGVTCRADLRESHSVMIKHKYENFRGILLDDDEGPEGKARVMRIDEGDYVNVPWKHVAPLPDDLAKWQAFCMAVYLDGILPAGGTLIILIMFLCCG